jgi:hypothetical protein
VTGAARAAPWQVERRAAAPVESLAALNVRRAGLPDVEAVRDGLQVPPE